MTFDEIRKRNLTASLPIGYELHCNDQAVSALKKKQEKIRAGILNISCVRFPSSCLELIRRPVGNLKNCAHRRNLATLTTWIGHTKFYVNSKQ